MITRNDIISKAREYLGTPFRHQGRSRTGLDCIGLIVRVAHDLELSKEDFLQYDRRPNNFQLQFYLGQHLEKRSNPKDILPGDIILFSLPSYPCHVAFYSDTDTIIHSLANRKKVVEHRLDEEWKSRIRGVYYFGGIE